MAADFHPKSRDYLVNEVVQRRSPAPEQKIQWLKDRSHLCVNPYVKRDFRFTSGGFTVTCCCNLDVDKPDDSNKFALIDQVTSAVDTGRAHPACWRCHDEERRGHLSERIQNLIQYEQQDLDDFAANGVHSNELEIGIKFSNLCNLACRSCNPYDSSMFGKLTGLTQPYADISVDISESAEHWAKIVEYIYDKQKTEKQIIIHPIGGETFLQPGLYKLMDWLIAQGVAKNISFRITTSLATAISQQLEDRFRQFKNVELLASVDSVGENFHYVRWPAQFDKIQRNLITVKRLFDECPEVFKRFWVLPIFSLNNIFYLPDILEFWAAWSEENGIKPMMDTHHLYRPPFLVIDILPSHYRSHLVEILDLCRDGLEGRWSSWIGTKTLMGYVKTTAEMLRSDGDQDESMFQHYLRFTADYDRRTGADSFSANSRLFDLLVPEHVDIYRHHYQTANINRPIHYTGF